QHPEVDVGREAPVDLGLAQAGALAVLARAVVEEAEVDRLEQLEGPVAEHHHPGHVRLGDRRGGHGPQPTWAARPRRAGPPGAPRRARRAGTPTGSARRPWPAGATAAARATTPPRSRPG